MRVCVSDVVLLILTITESLTQCT